MTLVFRYDTLFDDVYAGTLLLRTPGKEKEICRFYVNRECTPAAGTGSIGFKSTDTYSLCLFLRHKRGHICIQPLVRGEWFQELAWMQMRLRKLDGTNIEDDDYRTLMQKIYLRALDEGQNPRSMQCQIEKSPTLSEIHESLFKIEDNPFLNDDEW